MELTIKIEDKKMYDSFVQFFKSIGIKVVSLSEEEKVIKKHSRFSFNALHLKTKGMKFNREEANER